MTKRSPDFLTSSANFMGHLSRLALVVVAALACFAARPAGAAVTPGGPGTFWVGADASSLPQIEAAGATFRDSLGTADAITVLRRHGFGWVRLRLWNQPADGHGGLSEMLALAARARQGKMCVLLDLHYSDSWADPSRQFPPAAWAGLAPTVLQDSVYRYTRDVVAALVAQGTPPDMVQLGNEITNGILWDSGRVGGGFDSPQQWSALAALLKAGARGVGDGAPGLGVRLMLHVDTGGNTAASQTFFDHMNGEGVPYDVIGLSYYPWWQGTLDQLSANLANLANRYDRDIAVVETAYPWTLAAFDGTTNVVGQASQLHAGYPATPLGQAAFLRRVTEVVSETPRGHGRGVFAWEPGWIAAPGVGSAVENCACFDASGRALPALDALSAVDVHADDVLYQVMPIGWRDSNGDAYRFGDFGGMTASLPYLRGLGINGLWMTPVFGSPAYHGYQHMPPNLLNSWFGTEPQLLDFVRNAHLDSLRVYLDFVGYGVSQNSVFFQQSFHNNASPFTDFIAYYDPHTGNSSFDGGTYTSWNGSSVPFVKWNLASSITDSLQRWCGHWLDPNGDGAFADGIDGYRLDHVVLSEGWGYTIGWWTNWKLALQQVNPGVFTFAEQGDWGSHGAELLPGHDATFTKPFEFAARSAVAAETAAGLYSEMRSTLASLPPGKLYLCTLGDHDVDRLMTVIGDRAGRARVAAAIQMTQPLPPIVYFGDELGMRGAKGNFGSDANDIPFREPFKWNAVAGPPMSKYYALNAAATTALNEQDHDGRSVEEQQGVPGSLLETYRGLIRTRLDHVALRRGAYAEVPNSSAAVWAFARVAAYQESLVVAINLSGTAVTAALDLTNFAITGGTSGVRDVSTGAALGNLTTTNRASYPVALAAYGWRILSARVSPLPVPSGTLDGRGIPADFGAARLAATQNCATGLGDNAYELDQMFANAGAAGLQLGLTGNLGGDGSAIALLFDNGTPGQDTLRTTAFNPPPNGVAELTGLVMDTGFHPSVLLWINGYGGNLYVDRFQLSPAGGGSRRYVGAGLIGSGQPDLSGGSNANGLQAAFDNGNAAGVTATDASGAASATSGLEAFLPWADLGLPGSGGPLKVLAMIVRPDGTIGNQLLPGVGAGHANLGLAPLSLRPIAGNQYVALNTVAGVTPPPGEAGRRLALAPNPFRDSAIVRFTLARAARAEVLVLDAGGRRVRDLGAPFLDAGAREVRWDGRDQGGRAMPPGVYFIRVRTPERTLQARLVRIR